MEAIKKIGRLHELKKEKEELKKQLDALVAPLQNQLHALEVEEEEIRSFLEEEAIQNGQQAASKTGTKTSLSYPGLGSVSVTEKEEWDITDKDEAKAIVLENPVFVDAQKIDVDKKAFVKIALEIQKETGDLVSCVGKVKKRTTRITLAKIGEEEE
ncbi:hypothetical protein JK635_08130 [Neobacillus sp. YIM B02564]|uniref:Uncharacterized protein n=1 Tax=Neobacillus paridis TaxID=2803862 RepID=A0ABS1TLH5_9BACI|nr:hypothetical protein [Neobacillus paridis]MBL4952179.1 hypothetical protein [Neobacillus paridis]